MTRIHFLAVLTLTILWLLLWGDATPVLVTGGILVSLVIVFVFPFPAVSVNPVVRPHYFLVLVVVFLWDMTVASFQVAWLALRLRKLPPAALIEVPLITSSEVLQVLTAELICLVPGSLLIELDSEGNRMWLHVMNVSTPAALLAARKMAHDQEFRVLAALGSREEFELAMARRDAVVS